MRCETRLTVEKVQSTKDWDGPAAVVTMVGGSAHSFSLRVPMDRVDNFPLGTTFKVSLEEVESGKD